MTDLELADRVLRQGRALVKAIEALDITEPTGPIERFTPGLLQAAYKRRLRAIVEAAPGGDTERQRAHWGQAGGVVEERELSTGAVKLAWPCCWPAARRSGAGHGGGGGGERRCAPIRRQRLYPAFGAGLVSWATRGDRPVKTTITETGRLVRRGFPVREAGMGTGADK